MTETVCRSYLLSERFYPSDCVDRTIKEFSTLCDAKKTVVGCDTQIILTRLPGAPEQAPEEFMNFLLCTSLEKLLA